VFSNPYESSKNSDPGKPKATSERVSGRVAVICVLLLLASAVNYMDRQTLAVAAKRIISEFDLTKIQYGRIEAVFGYSFSGDSSSIASRCVGSIRSDCWVGP
jgi:sugar phosphate permease